MRTLYLDIFSGISGDMLIGALIDFVRRDELHESLTAQGFLGLV